MANTFTALQPLLFGAARIVPRELTGVSAGVDRDFNDKGVAKGDTVTVGVSPVASVTTHTAAQTFTAGTDRIASSRILTLGQESKSSWNLTPEQERSLGNGGTADDILKQTVEQHIRAHVNAIESYAWNVMRKGASRATGAAGTSAFATDQKPLADALKILLDNGAGNMDLNAAISTTDGANIRKTSNLFKVNEAGDMQLLRAGLLGNLYNFNIRESAAIIPVADGAGSSYQLNGSHAIGDTNIAVDTGTGTILAGDIIAIGAHKYVVKTGITAAGTLVINEPGLLQAFNDNEAVTLGADYTANVCYRKDAMKLVVRPGLQPDGGGVEQMTITDPQTGFSTLVYRAVGDGLASWYMRTVYDAFVVNNYAAAVLLS